MSCQVAHSSQPIRRLHSTSKQEVNDLSWIQLALYFSLLFVACSTSDLPRPSLLTSPALLSRERPGTRLFLTPSLAVLQLTNIPEYEATTSHGQLTTKSLLHATRKTSKSVSQNSFASLSHSLLGKEGEHLIALQTHTQTTCDDQRGWGQPHSQVFPTIQFFTVSDQNLDGGESLGRRLEQRRTTERGGVSLCSV